MRTQEEKREKIRKMLARWGHVEGLRQRAEKALLLHVKEDKVQSETNPEIWYEIALAQWPETSYSCTCKDWQTKTAPKAGWRRLCKHVIAYALEN